MEISAFLISYNFGFDQRQPYSDLQATKIEEYFSSPYERIQNLAFSEDPHSGLYNNQTVGVGSAVQTAWVVAIQHIKNS